MHACPPLLLLLLKPTRSLSTYCAISCPPLHPSLLSHQTQLHLSLSLQRTSTFPNFHLRPTCRTGMYQNHNKDNNNNCNKRLLSDLKVSLTLCGSHPMLWMFVCLFFTREEGWCWKGDKSSAMTYLKNLFLSIYVYVCALSHTCHVCCRKSYCMLLKESSMR